MSHKRKIVIGLALACGCGSTTTQSGFANGDASVSFGDDNGENGSDGGASFGDASLLQFGDGSAVLGADATTSVTTIYANTDDSLYTMDPSTSAVTLVGKFSGLGGSSGDTTVTDCAVNAAGVVYVNSETVVYRAALPASGGGSVALAKVATIAAKNTSFYALAFAPAGVLGSSETLIGGDGNGELWSIDETSGATKDLGNFGSDPNSSGNVYALSGDLVFYLDDTGKPTGLATIRSCKPKSSTCTTTDDYLAGIDMTALATAYTQGTPATSLNAGIYGGTTTSTGSGTGHGELFGLGAWNGDVFAFARHSGSNSAALLSIDTTSGKATVVSSAFSFTDGWSGAGVTTAVKVSVPPPPNTPR